MFCAYPSGEGNKKARYPQRRSASGCGPFVLGLARDQASPVPVGLLAAVTLQPLALQLASTTDSSGLFAGALFRRLLKVTAQLQREGVYREMKLRRHYEKPSEKRAREKAAAVRRARKLERKRVERDGGK